MTTRVKKRVSERVSLRVMHRSRSETLGKTLWHEKSRQESRREPRQEFCWDPLRDSWWDSRRDSRFARQPLWGSAMIRERGRWLPPPRFTGQSQREQKYPAPPRKLFYIIERSLVSFQGLRNAFYSLNTKYCFKN